MNYGTSWLRPFIILLALSSLTISCAERKQESARVSINLSSSNSSLNTKQVEHVVVNFGDRLFEWDCDKPSDCSEVSFELPSNENGLLQLLVVTEDTTSPIVEVNYGSVATQFKPGENRIPIPYTKVADFQNEARVIGRYIPGFYPGTTNRHKLYNEELTGEVSIFAQVDPTGKEPDMKIGTTEIFGGWLEIFVLQSDQIGFKYKFTGYNRSGSRFYENEPILNDLHDAKGLDLDSVGINYDSNRVMHYFSTQTYFEKDRDDRYFARPFPSSVIGFFGRANGKYLCSSDLSNAHVFNGDDNNDEICRQVNGDNSLCTSFFQWGQITRRGDVDGSSDTCNDSDVNEHEIDIEDIGENSSDVLGFFGPFIKNPAAGQDRMIEFDSGTGEFSWLVNGGAFNAGIQVLTRSASLGNFDKEDARSDDGYDCERLLKEYGFRKRGKPHTQKDVTINLVDLGAAGPGDMVALCPVKPERLGGGYFNHAIVGGSNSAGPGPQVPLFRLQAHHMAADSTPIQGRDFNSSDWNTKKAIDIIPADYGLDQVKPLFITIRNIVDEPIYVDFDLQSFTSGGSFTAVSSPASTPNGNEHPDCSSLGAGPYTLDAAGGSNDACVFRIDFDSGESPGESPLTDLLAGSSILNGVEVKAARVNNTDQDYHKRFGIRANVFTEINFAGGGASGAIPMYAPPGEFDVKYIRLRNTSGVSWTPTSLTDTTGRLRINPVPSQCSSTIANTDSCILKVTLNNVDGGLTNGSEIHAFQSGPNVDVTFNISSGPIEFDQPIPIDFGYVPTNTSQTVNLTNTTGATFYSLNYQLIENTFVNLFESCTGSLADGASCSLTLPTDISSSSPGLNRDLLMFDYKARRSYRVFEFEVLGFFD